MEDIYVINLEHRNDRLMNFKKIFNTHFNINQINAVFDENGWIGCLKSHLKCIKYAKENNLKYIIVFEDDCTITNNKSIERLKNIKENIFDVRDDWDIFIGGSTSCELKNINKYDYDAENIYTFNSACSTFCISYNHTCYDFFINCDMADPIDDVWHYKLKCIMPLPFLFTVIPSYSNINNINTNPNIKICRNERKLINYIKENNI